MERVQGIPVSDGLAVGRAMLMGAARALFGLDHPPRSRKAKDPEAEVRRLQQAIDTCSTQLRQLAEQTKARAGEEAAKIFRAHIVMLSDPSLTKAMREVIEGESLDASDAAHRVLKEWRERFASIADEQMSSKASDIDDIARRLLVALGGKDEPLDSQDQSGPFIAIADELTPTETVSLEQRGVVGIVTASGGPTGHTAIIARALGLPAIVGARGVLDRVREGQQLVVDAVRGVVLLSPDAPTLREADERITQRRETLARLEEIAGLEPVTLDAVRVTLLGNIEFPEEIAAVRRAGGEGVGLYRTEFLYLAGDHEPTEAEQHEVYARSVRELDGLPLTIRTLDLGADKMTQRMARRPERNPFLGMRSIRLSLRDIDLFRAQLRAILRASATGPIKIMFPLVSTLDEFRRARLIIREVMEDLDEQGVPYDEKIPIGMMVETPAAAIVADQFAQEADFFSIGTNDLVQYTLAADRTNDAVAHLNDPSHPAILRLISGVVRAANDANIPLSVCGEAAGSPARAALLLGLGVRTLSMAASALPQIRMLVRAVSMRECERIAEKALTLDSGRVIDSFVRDRVREIAPHLLAGRTDEL